MRDLKLSGSTESVNHAKYPEQEQKQLSSGLQFQNSGSESKREAGSEIRFSSLLTFVG